MLAPYAARARAHPGGMVDLSIGTPVDPTPELVQRALRAAANAPGYPTAAGSVALREAAVRWLTHRHRVQGLQPTAVIPTIGSKELVGLLPYLLGLGPGDRVVLPELCYPTYEVGVLAAGALPVRSDGLLGIGPAAVRLVWLNSPSNPTGRVLPVEHLRKVVSWARERGVVVASDECYLELGWEEQPRSILHPEVCAGSHEGLLAVHSLSKRSNLAGYRAGLVAGDPRLVADLLEVRKHIGLLVPLPVQAAMIAALDDEVHVAEQRVRYAARRAQLRAGLETAGFSVDHSVAGLYLWATRGEDCWSTVDSLAARGVLVAPGSFYGPAGRQHIRLALTATDDQVAEAVRRLG